MATEKLRDEFWDDFDATADIAPMIELVPELTSELMAVPSDDPESRVLWPPTDEGWSDAADHIESMPTEFQQRYMAAIAQIVMFAEHGIDAESDALIRSKEMLVSLGCHEDSYEFVVEALLARKVAYSLVGESALFEKAADVYKQYVDSFTTYKTQRADAARMAQDLAKDAMMSKLIDVCASSISGHPFRRENVRRIMCATIAQIAHYKELEGIADETSNVELFDHLATKSDIDSKYDLAPDPLPLVRTYADDELIQLPIATIMDAEGNAIPPRDKKNEGDDDYEKPVEQQPTELFTLMNKVIDARTKADAQIASRYWRAAEIQAEIVLRNLNYEETPKNVLLVHRARLAAFVIAGVPHKDLQPVRATFDNVGITKSNWPDMVERMKDGIAHSDVLTEKIDACLPFLIDSVDEQELMRTIIVVTIQQIQHWKQEQERSRVK